MSEDIIIRENDDRVDELEAFMADNYQMIECPLVHRFTPGMYIREIFMPAGSLITSKIHKTEHPFTVSKGKVAVSIDGQDWEEFEAPYTGITKPGTRRILYIIEDCIWTTYHLNPSDSQDLEEIEHRLIEPRENNLLKEVLENKKLEL
jgi:hypothetical protein